MKRFKTNALCKEKICSLDLCKSSYLVIMPPALKNRFFVMSFTEIRQKKRNLGETVDPFSALQNKEYSDK